MTAMIGQFGYVIQVASTYWESLAAVLAMFAAGSLFLQQTLLLVFEWDVFEKLNETSRQGKVVVYRTGFDLKPIISVACALIIVFQFQYDAFAAILQGSPTGFTMVMTAISFSGGSAFLHHLIKAYRQVREAEAELRISQARGTE